MDGLTLVGNEVTVSDGVAEFSYGDDNTYEYYKFPLELSGNTSDFIIDFKFKSDSGRSQMFNFYTGSDVNSPGSFHIYKADNYYWRIAYLYNGQGSIVRINHGSLTPANYTFGRYTLWYKYSENKFYTYVDGVEANLISEAGDGSRVSGNTFMHADQSDINASIEISFGKLNNAGENSGTNTFDHMYYDIGGTYTNAMISKGFVAP